MTKRAECTCSVLLLRAARDMRAPLNMQDTRIPFKLSFMRSACRAGATWRRWRAIAEPGPRLRRRVGKPPFWTRLLPEFLGDPQRGKRHGEGTAWTRVTVRDARNGGGRGADSASEIGQRPTLAANDLPEHRQRGGRARAHVLTPTRLGCHIVCILLQCNVVNMQRCAVGY